MTDMLSWLQYQSRNMMNNHSSRLSTIFYIMDRSERLFTILGVCISGTKTMIKHDQIDQTICVCLADVGTCNRFSQRGHCCNLVGVITRPLILYHGLVPRTVWCGIVFCCSFSWRVKLPPLFAFHGLLNLVTTDHLLHWKILKMTLMLIHYFWKYTLIPPFQCLVDHKVPIIQCGHDPYLVTRLTLVASPTPLDSDIVSKRYLLAVHPLVLKSDRTDWCRIPGRIRLWWENRKTNKNGCDSNWVGNLYGIVSIVSLFCIL